MFKSLDTNIKGHSGVEISYSSDEAYQLLVERRFENLEQCAFLFSFLNISPESEEWRMVSQIISELRYPENVISDFLIEDKFVLTAVPNTVDFIKTYRDEDLHCEAADTHFEDSYNSFEEMLLQQNLGMHYYISGQNGKPAMQIALFGIITLMPLQPIISLNNALLLPGVLYPLKLTREMAAHIHRYAMRRFIFVYKKEIIETIEREVDQILSGVKNSPDLTNALGKMTSDYIWKSDLGFALSSLVRELKSFNETKDADQEKKILRIVADVVSRVQGYKEAIFDIDFSTLLVKPGRMVTSNSRKTQHLVPSK